MNSHWIYKVVTSKNTHTFEGKTTYGQITTKYNLYRRKLFLNITNTVQLRNAAYKSTYLKRFGNKFLSFMLLLITWVLLYYFIILGMGTNWCLPLSIIWKLSQLRVWLGSRICFKITDNFSWGSLILFLYIWLHVMICLLVWPIYLYEQLLQFNC